MKNIKQAFTLIELLVIIAIIMITVLWLSNLNFKSAQDRQQLEILSNTIISQIETVRTNALIWKWVLSLEKLIVPKRRKIDISKNDSWSIITSYENDSDMWIIDETIELKDDKFKSISEINCRDTTSVDTWTLIFKWDNYSFSGNCLEKETKISIKIEYKELTQTIEFNRINWLIEKKD
jgi:Tfp pilus assembly protein FimT